MIDRPARELVVVAIDSFLNEEIDSSQFDDVIFDISAASRDETIQHVAAKLWCCYDELRPHKVRLERQGWNYVQRLRLLLQSDCEIVFERRWALGYQAVAVACLSAIVATAWVTGNSMALHVVCFAAGIVMWVLAPREPHPNPYHKIVCPFRSVKQLASVYRQTLEFQKARYPKRAGEQRGDASVEGVLAWLLAPVVHAFFAPLIVLAECFPSGDWRVIEPGEFGSSRMSQA
jgi:hypothetical protein